MWETLAQAVINGLLIGGIYALVSIGVTLIFGVLRFSNFAHAEGLSLATAITILFTIWLQGRGVLLSPGIPRRTPIVRVGQTLSLKRPDGSRVEGTVRGMASFGDTGAAIPLLVLLDSPDAEVPPGCEALTTEPLTV